MGAKCVKFFVLYLCSLCICISSYPVNEGEDSSKFSPEPTETRWPQLLALAFTVTCVLVLLGCLSCCKQRTGFKEFRNSVSESNVNSVGLDFVNPLQQNVQPPRHSIFSSIVEATIEKQPDSIVTFEPLPKVLPTKFTSNLRLPQFNGNSNDSGFIEEWLGDKDFPRQQLHYLRECGQGWFGKVVEGEARGILPSSNKVYRVIVRILKEDATATEQAHFLQEAKPYKDLSHPNVLKLLGRCLENAPFLLVFETCANGDLKSYLRQNVGNRDALIFQGIILRMAVDAASGLSYMLQQGFVHTDIAARNCLVTGDLRVKVGDYGTALQLYKDEYYINGDVALPIRWCAPETLSCSDTCIELKPVSGTSCIWSYGVLLWELEEWGELPYKDLTNDQVITKVFCEGYRLPFPSSRTPYSQEMYNIMQECWKDYVDRPSFIHVMNALSALMHRFKNNDFDSRWHISKPNTIPVVDNADKLNSRIAALSSKADHDSGIDLDNPGRLRGLSMSQLQRASSRQRIINDELSSESPASSRRFSNSSTSDLFSSPVLMKHRSPSLENLHGSLDNIGAFDQRPSGDEIFGSSSSDFWPKERRSGDVGDEESNAKLDFQLGLVSRNSDASILWNDKPLFQTDSYLEDTSYLKRVDSLATEAEDEIWRKRIERGEFTEKVKEKSKSVADLMVLTHIECSESSESDSLPSFHSRQSSFNRQCRRAPKIGSNAPLSLFNSLSFGSESNLPAVEKDHEFQDALKKIQIAKIKGDEDSLNLVSLQANPLVLNREDRDSGGGGGGGVGVDGGNSSGNSNTFGKIGDHFLANEASEKHLPPSNYYSSHINNACGNTAVAKKTKLPLFDNILLDATTTTTLERRAPGDGAESAPCEEPSASSSVAMCLHLEESKKKLVTDKPCSVMASLAEPVPTQRETASVSTTSDEGLTNSVVIGPSECDTLEYFKGLKTNLVDENLESPETKSAVVPESSFEPSLENTPQTLNEFLHDSNDDYFYKCSSEVQEEELELLQQKILSEEASQTRNAYCDFCYAKCHFSNECLRCKDKSLEENCSSESFENLEKLRDCTALNSCPFQSDDSGRGTDQINSGDGSSDKSLEGSISVQMNEVKNRLEDVIAKFAATDELSDDNCSSLEDDKDVKYADENFSANGVENFIQKVKLSTDSDIDVLEVETDDDANDANNDFKVQILVNDEKQPSRKNISNVEVQDLVIEEVFDDIVSGDGVANRRDSLLAISEENDNSASFDEDTCIGTGMGSSNSGKWSDDGESEFEPEIKEVVDDEKSSSSRTFVKVEQLFFTVDPKFELEYEAELSKSESFSKFDESTSESVDANVNEIDGNATGLVEKSLSTTSETKEIELQMHKLDKIASVHDESAAIAMNGAASPNDESITCDKGIEYEIDDILEGLLEPISLPYSVNRLASTKTTTDCNSVDDTTILYNADPAPVEITSISSNWLPSPIDDDDDDDDTCCKRSLLNMDETFIEAIRNELREKLPNTSTLAIVEPEEPSAPENANITIEYNSYPAQLSPILEEEENCSLASSLSSLSSRSESESTSQTLNGSLECGYDGGDDLLVVNIDTHEASIVDTASDANTLSSTLFQQSPEQQQHQHQHNLNETYEIVDENDDTIAITDPLDSDSFPTPDSLSPGTSSKTEAHHSYSSSDCGNLSDVFLSPSSSKNFDDFDMDRPTDDSRHLNTPENVLQSDCRDNYQKAILNIDEMLKYSELSGGTFLLTPTSNDTSHCDITTPENPSVEELRHNDRGETWLKSFFMPIEETTSMLEFDSSATLDETEFRSLPADFKSENWPTAEELVQCGREEDSGVVDGQQISDKVDVVVSSASTDRDACVRAETTSVTTTATTTTTTTTLTIVKDDVSHEETNQVSHSPVLVITPTSCFTSTPISNHQVVESSSNPVILMSVPTKEEASTSLQSSVKQKNSIALFGNTCKQIRNFQVSVVEDDCYGPNARTSPTTPKNMDVYFGERLLGTSPKHSEKTWKSSCSSPSLNSFLGSQNLETLGLRELNVNDMMMSTSFIENGSHDGSVDGRDENQLRSDESDDNDDEGVESTCSEFVWKKNDETFDVANSDDKKTDMEGKNDEEDDDEDDDDEELTDFVPFSWNSDAIPRRSALKNKDGMIIDKKNVSFKKQKYHCVYEYPKEEPNYSRRYDSMLQERMLNFLNLNQDYLCNDYSSFSDWELDDCEEQPTSGDDLLPYPASPALSSRSNLSNKLGFYTIGTYDIDLKTDDTSPNNVNSNAVSSPTVYSAVNSSVISATQVSPDSGEKNCVSPNAIDRPASSKYREFNFESVKISNGDKPPSSMNDVTTIECCDLPSPGLGELRHTKSRLKLDLNSKVLPLKVEPVEKFSLDECEPETPTITTITASPTPITTTTTHHHHHHHHHHHPGKSELLEENNSDDFVNDFGLNYKSCDISPVVELKPLTSTSVA